MAFYAMQIMAGRETAACGDLRRLGFSVFAPRIVRMIRVTRWRRARMIKRSEPLFRGYAFVELPDDARGWRVAETAVGCVGFVRFGDAAAPSRLRGSFVETLIAACDADGVMMGPARGTESHDPLRDSLARRRKMRVKMASGAFAGLAAEIMTDLTDSELAAALRRLDGAGRLAILVRMLGGPRLVEVARSDVVLSEAPPHRRARTASSPEADAPARRHRQRRGARRGEWRSMDADT